MKALVAPLSLAIALTGAAAPSLSDHQARVTGALRVNLAGQALFGPTRTGTSCAGAACPGQSFSIVLGAYSEKGAVVFSRVSAERPGTGTYEVAPFTAGAEKAGEFHALVSLGSTEAPLGAFRAMGGTVTITQSTEERIAGRYEIRARGFLAADLENEDREIVVRGSFTAEPAPAPSRFEATLHGAVQAAAAGAAEFGAVGTGEHARFSLSLGAYSEQGAIVIARAGAERPAPGAYRVREAWKADAGEFHALVITGSPSHPTGVFRARSGMVTITESSPDRLSGTFQLHAVGFLAASPEEEWREVLVSGSFTASATGGAITLTVR